MREHQHRREPTGRDAARREAPPPEVVRPLDARAVMRLQRIAGNAAVTRMVGARRIQRFDESEHKAIGDKAVSNTRFRLSPLVQASYGDLVALGDYFRDVDQMASLAGTPGSGMGTIGEVYYALFVRVQGADESRYMGGFFDESAKKAVLDRYYKLAGRNVGHFPNPFVGDAARGVDEKAGRHDAQGHPVGGLATYRQAHLRAVRRAVELAAAGRPPGGALAIDAFGAHFLTDAFSAGHIRTPRVSISKHWDKRVPRFNDRFLRWMANEIAFFIDHAGSQAEQAWPNDDTLGAPGKRSMALDSIKAALKGMPAMGFGDVVGLAVHDFDSERGVLVEVQGKRMKLVGDGQLLEPDGKGGTRTSAGAATTMAAAVRAVELSAAEVEDAYRFGKAGLDEDAVVAKLTAPGKGLFAAERLIPVPIENARLAPEERSLRWGFETVQELFRHPPMRKALVVFANNKAATFDTIVGDPKIPEVARQALQLRVAARLATTDPNAIVGLLEEILRTGDR